MNMDKKIVFAIENLPGRRLTLFAEIARQMIALENQDFLIYVIGLVPEADKNKASQIYDNNLRNKNFADIKDYLQFHPQPYTGVIGAYDDNTSTLFEEICMHIDNTTHVDSDNPAMYSVLLDLMLFEGKDETRTRNNEKVLSHKLYDIYKSKCGLYSGLQRMSGDNPNLCSWANVANIKPMDIDNILFWHIPHGKVNKIQAHDIARNMYNIAT
jgi:hypothetical protein